MVDIQTVSIVVASAGLLIAAIYYVFEVRHQSRARDTELVMRLYSTFSKKKFQQELQNRMKDFQSGSSYSELIQKYGALASEAGFFFEGLGILLHRKLIDISLVDDLFSGWITRYWEAARKYVQDARKTTNYPQFGEWVEYLYNEMKKREQKGVKNA